MWESGYYPAGAEHDPNAPYNETSIEDYYGDDARSQIDEEIDTKDPTFVDWAYENDHLPEDYTDEDVDKIVKDDKVRSEYQDYRLDDVMNELAENDASERDYYECERAEAIREAYLLGDY